MKGSGMDDVPEGGWSPPGGWDEGGAAPTEPIWFPPRPDVQEAPRRRLSATSIAAGVLAVLVLVGSGIGIGWGLGSHTNTVTSAPRSPEAPIRVSPSPVASGKPLSLHQISLRVSPAVVDINVVVGQFGNGQPLAQAAGTGMIVTGSGEVLTNNHVIAGATSIHVTIQHRGEYEATVLGADPVDDVALLQVQGISALPTVSLGADGTVAIGDRVVAIGNALGRGGAPSVTQGEVRDLHRSIDVRDEHGGFEHLQDVIQIDAPISPGDSGGAVVDAFGKVIGMITAARTGPNRPVAVLGYAIPVDGALRIVNLIRAGRSRANVIVGVQVDDLTPSRAARLGFGVNSGAYVAGVIPGKPAAKAGMRAPAIITQVDGTAVDSTDALGPMIYTHRPGDTITVTWVDRQGTHTSHVQLVAGPPV
jgi:S1-C subfamily serine protease